MIEHVYLRPLLPLIQDLVEFAQLFEWKMAVNNTAPAIDKVPLMAASSLRKRMKDVNRTPRPLCWAGDTKNRSCGQAPSTHGPADLQRGLYSRHRNDLPIAPVTFVQLDSLADMSAKQGT